MIKYVKFFSFIFGLMLITPLVFSSSGFRCIDPVSVYYTACSAPQGILTEVAYTRAQTGQRKFAKPWNIKNNNGTWY